MGDADVATTALRRKNRFRCYLNLQRTYCSERIAFAVILIYSALIAAKESLSLLL